MKQKNKVAATTNWPLTILLIVGCLTVIFPLYMALVIAFKKPSEMTNDIAGALSLPGALKTSRKPCVLQTSGTPWDTVS